MSLRGQEGHAHPDVRAGESRPHLGAATDGSKGPPPSASLWKAYVIGSPLEVFR